MPKRLRRKVEKPPKPMKPRTYRPIHLATLIVLTIIAVGVTGIAAGFMWDAAQVPASLPNSPDLAVREAQLRVDVIRNILAVGAGTGGLVALFIALRRQYVKERVDFADQQHKNQTAEDTKHDAAEKRITDLYVKAAEQLGSEKAPVRMAALYTLERLAQDNPGHQQTVTNLICSYLRMPFPVTTDLYQLISESESKPYLPEDSNLVEELEVRRAAQDLLYTHLRYFSPIANTPIYDQSYWGTLDLNLRGATLVDFDLSSCRIRGINLTGAYLIGEADFSSCRITGALNAARAIFDGSAEFSRAKVDHFANFRQVRFMKDSDFTQAEFRGVGYFSAATFADGADFSGVATTKLLLAEAVAAEHPPTTPYKWPEGYTTEPTDKAGWDIVVKSATGKDKALGSQSGDG